MKYLGKKYLGEPYNVLADEYAITMPDNLWNDLLQVASETELQAIMATQIRFENYEAANQVKIAIESKKSIQ